MNVTLGSLAILCALLPAVAAGPTTSLPPTAATAPLKIEALAWMAGDWDMTAAGEQTDEHWTRPAGGTLLGMSRTIVGGKTVFFEFLRIETRKDGVYYVAQPQGKPGTDFKLVRVEGQSAVFENPTHDFPKRILYRREPDGGLYARVEGDGTEREKPQDYHYRGIPCR